MLDYIRSKLNFHFHCGDSLETIERVAEELLIKEASYAMKQKLEKSRIEKGRVGWWNEKVCSIGQLKQLLKDHTAKCDMVDIMNIAAMIYVREQTDPPPAAPQEAKKSTPITDAIRERSTPWPS